MGQALSICTGKSEEERKINGFKNVGVDLDHNLAGGPHHTTANSDIHDPYNSYNDDEDYLDAHHDDVDGYGCNEIRRQMDEQARLDALVVEATRSMVFVNDDPLLSRCDPSYADEFLQYLRETRVLANIPVVVKDPRRIPTSSIRPEDVMEVLTQGPWENILLGTKGVDPGKYLDDVAKELMSSLLPNFEGVEPIIDNSVFEGFKPFVKIL